MKIEEYEREHRARYQSFADAVRTILQSAISIDEHVPRPQSIQARAKTPDSLRKRLTEMDQIDADIEVVRKDLAGVRVIFYTNTDVDRFLSAGIIFGNFDVDTSSTKIHHPVGEGQPLYRAVHYIVKLSEARAALPEYHAFAGMRCEIQIQTILIHAWAETSHDIIYKTEAIEGFGTAAMESIRKRFNGIMDKYLLPAGYEFQRVQHDYERLTLGKELFNQNILESLQTAPDNNERHALLTSLKDDVLPHYDSLAGVFREVSGLIESSVLSARDTATKPIPTAFGDYPGRDAGDVTRVAVEILDTYCYIDVELTYGALETLFPDESDDRLRKKMLEVAGHLSGFNIRAWRQVGPAVQYRLADVIERHPTSSELRPLAITVWEKLLGVEADDAVWSADSVSLQSWDIPVAAVAGLRDRAITALLSLFEASTDDSERQQVVVALESASRTSYRGDPKSEMLSRTLEDNTRIVRFYCENVSAISYELRETIEHSALYSYYRARELADDPEDKLGCRARAETLIVAMLAMRDAFNEDEFFIRYKTLVGFESVFAQQWEDRDLDYEQIERYREQKIGEFIDELTPETQTEWLPFIERCASTKSNDMATFPKFGAFLTKVSERKSDVGDFLLTNAGKELLAFLPAFLNGLMASGKLDLYHKHRDRFIDAGRELSAISRHWRISVPTDQDAYLRLLAQAIKTKDEIAVMECMLFAIENAPSEAVPPPRLGFRPAIIYLTKAKDARWVNIAWFGQKNLPFFDDLSGIDGNLILSNLLFRTEADYQTERVLALVAKRHLDKVWKYFGARLRRSEDKDGYRAIPFRFQLLSSALAANASVAIEHVREWFREDPRLFRFRGGRLLGIAFPVMTLELSAGLIALVNEGSAEDAMFVSEILQTYQGETPTHGVLQALIDAYPDDQRIIDRVSTSFDNTGVVTGEYGYVRALQAKRELLHNWLEDERPAVVKFAENHVRDLELRIAQEQRRADAERALRKLQYPEIDAGEGGDAVDEP